MSGQRCFLCLGPYPEDWSYHPFIANATAMYLDNAEPLAKYGQELQGSLHFVDHPQDKPVEYPDRVLSLGPKGGLKMERT